MSGKQKQVAMSVFQPGVDGDLDFSLHQTGSIALYKRGIEIPPYDR